MVAFQEWPRVEYLMPSQWLREQSDRRFQELLQQMNALTKALPAGVDTSTANSDKKGWAWWPAAG